MTVAVMSTGRAHQLTDTLDDLEKWTRDSFSAVSHNQLPPPDFKSCPSLFPSSKFNKLYKVVSVADENEVHLTWALDSLVEEYRTKPLDYLGWLVGHEGEGSILHHLMSRNLATEICAGNGGTGYENNSCFSFFTCTITLTDKGHEQILECVSTVFQYLKLLRQLAPQERIYREIQLVEKNRFTFKEEVDPVDYVEELCEAMQYYPEEDYLTGDSLLYDYNPQMISMVTELLVPDLVNIIWVSRKFEGQCLLKEKWFGTSYCCEDVPSEWRRSWENLGPHPNLHLPNPNPFLATDFTIKEPVSDVSKYPVVVEKSDRCQVWFRQDSIFKLPRAWVGMLLVTPLNKISAKNAALFDLFLELLEFSISDELYSADIALLKYSASIEDRGVVIKINGLNHKLPFLFRTIVDKIASFSTIPDKFDMIKDKLHRSYRNELLEPDELCNDARLRVLLHSHWSLSEREAALGQLTGEDLTQLVDEFKKQLFAEFLVQGNITAEEAKDLATYLCSKLTFDPLPSGLQFQPRVVQLPACSEVVLDVPNRNTDCPNTVVTDYYQCCVRTLKDEVITEFLTSCMEEPAFDILRTKKQLGYGVYPSQHNGHGVLGISLTLVTQTHKHSVAKVSECMAEFVRGFYEVLCSWSQEEFQSHVESLIQQRLEPDRTLKKEAKRNWAEVLLQRYHFDHLLQEVGVLRSLTQDEVCHWLRKYTHDGEHHKKLKTKVLSHVVSDSASVSVVTPTPLPPSPPDTTASADDYCDSPSPSVSRILLQELDIDRFKEAQPSIAIPHNSPMNI